ncbi:hypothetical protein LIER_14029 [Lithospermum erythrorhizon]|uniref:Uncharacterized protein n=1 Tax=Lithospermum erythrorhizon TaxID=34254 RepID=A0AAV3PZ61_LITER
MPISRGGLGIEMDLLQASSFESTQGRMHGSGLVLRELFDPVSSETLLLGVKHQALDRTSSISGCRNGLPPMEEEVEADLQFFQISTEPIIQFPSWISYRKSPFKTTKLVCKMDNPEATLSEDLHL